MYDKLTQKDIDKIEEEIAMRKLELRPKLIAAVKEAREQGDLSENFEYYAAKREKNQNESRIRYLERMVKTANIIEDKTKADEVGIGKTITIYIPEDDEEETYKIVTTIRGDALNNLITIESPLGKALLNHKVGDIVTVHVDDKFSYDVEIRKIDDTSSDDSDAIRSF